MQTLYFGLMSTASVNDYAFLPPVKNAGRVKLMAVASRDADKASKYADRHNIPRSYGDYDSLLADELINCVYIPLPVSMHAEWSIKALEAGKNVLCEKPVAANAAEALAIDDAAKRTGMVFAEAFHYRYHPLAAKIEEIARSGDIGEVTHISSQFGVPLPDKDKVQFKPELAGGALLDIGCYPVSFSRWIAGCDDASVTGAAAELTPSGVDGSMSAKLKFENGVEAEINCSLTKYLPQYATIRGTEGSIFVFMPFSPAVQIGQACVDIYVCMVRKGMNLTGVRVPSRTTYYSQLLGFCRAVRDAAEPITNAREAVSNMRLIDSIYAKAAEG